MRNGIKNPVRDFFIVFCRFHGESKRGNFELVKNTYMTAEVDSAFILSVRKNKSLSTN